jgi:ABC-type polysaccharide/polyol phosphate transport system ATPase subunit
VSGPPAVVVDAVSKRFRVYHDRNQSLKATVLRGGRARYEDFWALDDVSLEVPTGTTFGLIGTNGSGKSTLLKCMAKILRPDKGSIATQGKLSALLELGAGFHPELSGRDNVFLNGAILGMSQREIHRRFDDIVGFAGLERFIDTPVKNYSSGMYVRLGFSVAINVNPDVLLVDEVLAVGDEQFQRRCAEKFAELRRAGKTIVVVSHSLGTLQQMCDVAAWLDGGVLAATGPAAEVVDAYLSSFQTDEGSPAEDDRFGTGEIRVEKVQLLDRDGKVTTSARTGDSVTFRFHYTARHAVTRPVFGIGIYTIDGTFVTGPNLKDAGQIPDVVDRPGTVEIHIPKLLLLPGSYDVASGVSDDTVLHVHDHWRRALRFDVLPGTPHEAVGGIVSLEPRWTLIPDAAPAQGRRS